MFETGLRQLRMAGSLIWGRPMSPANLERLVADALATMREFGSPGDDVGQLLEGPFADPTGRRILQDRALRRTAERAAAVTAFYGIRFREAGLDPATVDVDSIRGLPLTSKADLTQQPDGFLATGVRPYLATRTTGTTGRPVEVWMSRHEAALWPALAALAGVLRGEITPGDCMQVNISSRATAAVQHNVSVCRLAEARCVVLGVVPPDETLDSMLESGVTLLSTYPSYLALLVLAAHRRGLSAADFALRRIDCGGEVLSTAVRTAAQTTFGTAVNDTFAMTEVLPVSARSCSRGHLHHDLNAGLVEVLDPSTGDPVGPGDLGSVVVTPYFPFRDCMPVLRYDTRDLVRTVADDDLRCELAGTPGTSLILGKSDRGLAAVLDRDLIEALEAAPSRPWPLRYVIESRAGHPLVHVRADQFTGMSADEVTRLLFAYGVSADVTLDDDLPNVGPGRRMVRADLMETTFTRPTPFTRPREEAS